MLLILKLVLNLTSSATQYNAAEMLPSVTEEKATQILENMWYILAEKIFNRVIEVTDLDKARATALRTVALRPNDFRVIVTDSA